MARTDTRKATKVGHGKVPLLREDGLIFRHHTRLGSVRKGYRRPHAVPAPQTVIHRLSDDSDFDIAVNAEIVDRPGLVSMGPKVQILMLPAEWKKVARHHGKVILGIRQVKN